MLSYNTYLFLRIMEKCPMIYVFQQLGTITSQNHDHNTNKKHSEESEFLQAFSAFSSD